MGSSRNVPVVYLEAASLEEREIIRQYFLQNESLSPVFFLHWIKKHAESSKEIYKVLDLPELNIVKPSDTLACICALHQSSKR